MGKFYRLLFLWILWLFAENGFSQSCVLTGLNGTVINLSCGGGNCTPLQLQVPHLKSSEDYKLVSIQYNPLAYETSSGNELMALYADDKFSNLIDLTFPFCFYDSIYSKVVVGSNGLITFDEAAANGQNAWPVNSPIPASGGSYASAGTQHYPPSSIMAAFTDLNPIASASPRGRRIEWRIEGAAPCRKFIASFFRVGMFGANSCSAATPTTFQMIIYEGSGLIDFFIENKSCLSTSSGGRAIMGIQNWQRNKFVAGAGRNATVWTASNEGWRFVPSGATSRFSRSELYDLAGTLLQTTSSTDTATTTPGLLDINFASVCFTGLTQSFVLKTYYTACSGGAPLVSTDTFTINKNALPVVAAVSAAGCSPTGTATIKLPAGNGPYTFTLNANAPVISAVETYTFTGLLSGTYTLAGSNGTGCSGTTTVTVPLNETLQVLAAATPTTCSGLADGTITLFPQNGTPPYLFNINNGPFQSSTVFTNLAPGAYSIGMKDASGCVLTNYSVTVSAGGAVTASVAATNVSCNGGTNGRIIVTPSANAILPVQYSLDGTTFQTSNTFNGLVPGSYTVYFKDANNCGGTQIATINQPSPLSQSIVKADVLCNGGNGSINIAATGGTAPYQYSIDGVTYTSSSSFSIAAGNYTVFVKDAAGCITNGTTTILQPPVLDLSAQSANASCNGGADGSITITASGGAGNFQYSINGTSFQSSNIFAVTQGTYTVTLKDANGCTKTTTTIVGLTNNLTLSLPPDTTICEGQQVQLNATTNATVFSWLPAGSLNNSAIANPVASPVSTTNYILTAVLGACTIKDSVVVNVNPAPLPNAGINNEICFGQGYQLQGSGGVTFQWSPTTYFNTGSTTSSQNPAITPAQSITYSLNVVDNLGCASLRPATVTITVTPPIQVKASPRDTVVAKGDVFVLRAISPVNDYIWSPAFGLDNPTKQNPVATIDRDIIYTVTAYTGAGCKGSDTVKIKVYDGPEIYVPTAFTPNGDGRNDLLKPFPVGIKELRFFRVFNRWGQMIYQTSILSAGWDGRLNGVLQPTETYVWVLEAVTKENVVVKKRGTSTLIR